MTLGRRPLLAALAAAHLAPAIAAAEPALPRKVRIVQASPSLAYLPLAAARALGSFPAQRLDLFWTDLPGGDRACLLALERGNADVAALAAESALAAIQEGRPIQMVAALFDGLPHDLVLGNRRLESSGSAASSGIAPADEPPQARLRALKGAIVGLTSLGGPEEHAVRFLARLAGLQQSDLVLDPIPPPATLDAALDSGRIDAALVSPPAGLLIEDARIGRVILHLSGDVPALRPVPSLVLAVPTPLDDEAVLLLRGTIKALQAAAAALGAEPGPTAARIAAAVAPRLKPSLVATAIDRLRPSLPPRLRFQPLGLAALLAYAGVEPDPARPCWTNRYCDDA